MNKDAQEINKNPLSITNKYGYSIKQLFSPW